MKLTTILLLVTALHVTAKSTAQKITWSGKSVALQKVFSVIEKQTGFFFFYDKKDLDDTKSITVSLKDSPLQDALKLILTGQPLEFDIQGNTIFITRKKEVHETSPLPPATEQPQPRVLLKGRVVDDKSGEPISDASVLVKGSQTGVSTDRQGEFSLVYSGRGNVTLIISHIGYSDKEVTVKDDSYITIRMLVSEESLANVEVSTGMYKRKKESFTGATATFTGAQLRQIGNRNIIQSLKTLDPSFIVVENNRLGSDPNKLPTIELRGKTSISTTDLNGQYASDPNLPLFILNGFPTTLEIVNNLDMNRVANITILKDAASTAIWGSKAANGVVVIETKKPVAGELRVSYNGDFSVDAPDLSSYNLMNASEKLEFEKLSGLYTAEKFYTQYDADVLYNKRLADVKSGVNTYWLSEPVQTGFTNGHSLQLTGGNNELLFGAGISYRDQIGVMKGSDRKTWGANVDLTYRKGKLNITNQLYLSGYRANQSPYGSFADYAKANPFLPKRNADGTIPRYSDNGSLEYNTPGTPIPNPLYNASLFSINRTDNLDITNNLQGIFTILPELWLQGGLQVISGTTSTVVFVSPENTIFDGTLPIERGTYTRDEAKVRRYDGNLSLTYARIFAQTHSLNVTLRSDVSGQTTEGIGLKAIGFPIGTNGNPAFAYKYDPYSTPPSSTTVVHAFSTTGSLNYVFKTRYLLDLVYTLNGSNAFGSDNKYQPSWSAGLGWNLHRENFMRRYTWINLLKLRANIGISGNEQLGAFSSNSVFTALAGSNIFGQSVAMTQLGNRALEWQNTHSVSPGVDFAFLNNQISGYINYYEKMTDPLIVSASGILPSSAGLQFAYPVNVGKMTYKGWEANLRVSPIYRVKERIVWTIGITGKKETGRYSDFGNALDAANKEQTEHSGLVRYLDGYSPDDMWAVQSKGIDPATGREIFLKKDGTKTFAYNADDIVKVGNSRPEVEGVINSTLNYKGLSLSVNLRYRVAGYLLNTALYDRVENISFLGLKDNQDKRALYGRWQKPGDISEFKGIYINDYTPISSRFVQKDSHLVGEAFSLGWDFLADSWIRKLNMQGLRITLYASDIFRLSSVKTERGIDYPFSRSFSLNVNASF